MRGARALLTALLLSAAVTAPALARDAAFRTRSGKIKCLATNVGRRNASLRCDDDYSPRVAIVMKAGGRASRQLFRHRMTLRHMHVLSGSHTYGAFRCAVSGTTLSCRTGHNHGFKITSQFQETF
jgi:hypothetical protein